MRITCIIISLCSFIFSTTHLVPEEYSTIQAGIDVAVDGDTVLVNQGIYNENLHLTKSIVLSSYAIYDDLNNWIDYNYMFFQWEVINDNISNTVINANIPNPNCGQYEADITGIECEEVDGCEWGDEASTCSQIEDYYDFYSAILIYSEDDSCLTPKIFGFTITNGQGTYVQRPFPTPDGEDDQYQRIGGGILFDISNPIIEYNQFLNNGSGNTEEGGAIYSTTLDEDWSFNNRDLNRRYRCDIDEFTLENNLYNGNNASLGKTLANKGFTELFNMSESIFDVANCGTDEISDVWVYIEPAAELDISDLESNLCANTNPDIYIDSNIDYECEDDGCGTELFPYKTITWGLSMIMPSEENPVTIHLANGMYSSGESFPIYIPEYVSIDGDNQYLTIISANRTSYVLDLQTDGIISNLTVTKGGGGCGIGGSGGYTPGGTYGDDVGIEEMVSAWCDVGGINIVDASPIINYVTISDNIGTIGGIRIIDTNWLDSNNSYTALNNVEIIDNRGYPGTSGVGGLSLEGSGVNILNSMITNNESGNVGGIKIVHNNPVDEASIIKNVTISNNEGVGLKLIGPPSEDMFTLDKVLISENYSGAFSFGSGGIFLENSDPTIMNSTIVSNTSTNGGGLYLTGDSSPFIFNSIIWYNMPIAIKLFTGDPVITYSAIEGGWDGDGNINDCLNPLFTDIYNADCTLQENSPCVDAGTIFEGMEYYGLAPDMGAFEWTPELQSGDLNHDVILNIIDIIIFTSLIMQDLPYNNQADLNADGTVGIIDIILLVNIILGI